MIKRAISIVAVLLFTLGTAFAQQGQGTRNSDNKSPEEAAKSQTERMTKKLELTESQSKSVYSILFESATNKEEIKARYPEMEKVKAEMQASQKESKSKVQSILTTEQKEKQREIRQSTNNKRKGEGRNEDFDPNNKLEQMKTDLDLTDQQVKDLTVVFENASKNRAEVKSKCPELEQAKKEMKKNHDDTQKQLQKVLSAEQYKMLQKKGPKRGMKGKK